MYLMWQEQKACVPVENSDPRSLSWLLSNFYKPILNDPTVTGVDLTYINSLQKPFKISVDY
jgi:hypothetical protein